MAWYNDSRRHALASKGIKTGTKIKPIGKVPIKIKCGYCGAISNQSFCSGQCATKFSKKLEKANHEQRLSLEY